MNHPAIDRSRALWNRSHADVDNDEILAQLLDWGEPAAWRELYQLASRDARLRQRIHAILYHVPIAYPGFWLAALQTLGEPIDWSKKLPKDEGY